MKKIWSAKTFMLNIDISDDIREEFWPKSCQFKLSDTRLLSRIGYQFKHIELLQLALTHRSVSHKTNYERLEFSRRFIVGEWLLQIIYIMLTQTKMKVAWRACERLWFVRKH